jgi:hypothetical protein
MNSTFQMYIQRYTQHFPAAGEIVITSGNTERADRPDGRGDFHAIAFAQLLGCLLRTTSRYWLMCKS